MQTYMTEQTVQPKRTWRLSRYPLAEMLIARIEKSREERLLEPDLRKNTPLVLLKERLGKGIASKRITEGQFVKVFSPRLESLSDKEAESLLYWANIQTSSLFFKWLKKIKEFNPTTEGEIVKKTDASGAEITVCELTVRILKRNLNQSFKVCEAARIQFGKIGKILARVGKHNPDVYADVTKKIDMGHHKFGTTVQHFMSSLRCVEAGIGEDYVD